MCGSAWLPIQGSRKMKFIGGAQPRTDYRIVQNFGEVKLWRIDHFRVLARENVGEFTMVVTNLPVPVFIISGLFYR